MLLRTSARIEPSASSASERAGGRRVGSSSALSQASSAAAVSRAAGLLRLGDGRMAAEGVSCENDASESRARNAAF